VTVPIDPSSESGTSTRLFPKGRLKIFLGASPGVGKTFAMLQAAAEQQAEGVDVVVGLVETHKRKETEEQLARLEVLPRKVINYRGRSFQELDLDGVLARAPQLVLIDECAHSNIPGSRHPKRYNDIAEILEQGIDVYTTVNIQHFDSLKDDVEKVTHVKIRETIPDSFIHSADELQLIDLPPGDLLKRLKDGKVYLPEQAQVAIEHFFNDSNLLWLRELALRQTATAADEKTVQYRKQHGIKGLSSASDRVMVCIGTNPSDEHLVRTAYRIAERLHVKWTAVTVETSDDEDRSLIAHQQLSRTLQLAEELRAEIIVLDGTDIADTLLQYALTNNVTDMIVGQSPPTKLWQKIPILGNILGRRSLAEQILSHHPPLTVRVIPVEKNDIKHKPSQSTKSPLLFSILPYVFSLMITFGMLFAAEKITKYTNITDASTFLFLSILWVSIKFGLWPALLSTIFGSLMYDYYYIDPKYTLGIMNLEGWMIFLSFTFAALVISNLAIHSRNVLSMSQGRLRQIRFFSKFSNQLVKYSNREQVIAFLCKELHRFLNISVIAFWDTHDNLKPVFQSPTIKNLDLTGSDASAIQWALAHKSRSGKSTENFSDAAYLYLPLKMGNNSIGVVGIRALKNQLTVDDLNIAQILLDHSALAIDRLNHLAKQTVTKDKARK
jgi:two-component system, OmpR family, sensor histidine kinase KdpD